MRNVQVNLNGNTRNDLMEEVQTAAEKLREARETFAHLTLHGRNYQTCKNPAEAFEKDREDRLRAIEKFNAIDDYLHACYQSLFNQGVDR